MTTSGPENKATAEPPGEAETVPDSTVAGDEQELRRQIEQTREQLGETVEQLASKTDLKGKARAKAAGLAGRVKASTAQLRAKAAARAGGMRSQAGPKTVMARQKAAAVGGTAKAQLQARAAPVWHKAPEPVRRAAGKGASVAKQRRVPLIAAAATLAAGYLLMRWRSKR